MNKDSEIGDKIYWFECKNINVLDLYTYPLAYVKHFSGCTFREGDIIGISEYPDSWFKSINKEKHIIYFDLIERFKEWDKKLIVESTSHFKRSKNWIEISDKINRGLKLKNIIDENIDI